MRKIAHVIDAILTLRDHFSAQLQTISNNLSTFERNSRRITRSIRGTSKAFEKTGSSLTKGLTLPLVGIGVAAVKCGQDFSAQMSRVKAISGATKSQFKELEDQALSQGQSTAYSAKQVALAQEQLASAGFSTNEILKAIPGTLSLAASSGIDLATASSIAATSVRGFGLDVSQTSHVADVLASSAAKTNADVQTMGTAFGYVAPIARSVGWSIESVSSAVGKMADASIDGSTAGTTLRGIISRLAKPSDKAAGLMEKLGMHFYDNKGKMKGLSDVVQECNSKMQGLTDHQKQYIITTLFGQEAMSGMMVLMQNGKPKLDELTKSLQGCNGASADMAKTMQDNGKASIEQMFGAMETAAIKIEKVLAPTIKKIAESVGTLMDKFSALSPKQQEMIIKFALIAASVGPVLLTIAKLSNGVRMLLFNFTSLIGHIREVGGVMAFLSTPGMIVVGVIAALVVGAILIVTHWKEVSNCFKWVAKKLSDFTGITKGKLMAVINVFKRFANTIKTRVVDAFKGLVSKVSPHLNKFINTVKRIFKQIKPVLLPILAFLGGTFVASIMSQFSFVATVISTAINFIGTTISGLLDIFSGFLDFIVGVFTGNWSQAWEGIKSMFSGNCSIISGLWNGIISLLSAPVQAIVDILDSAFHDKIASIKSAWDGIKTFLSHPIQGIVSLVQHGDLSGVGKNALGTPYWGGGYTVVGEYGPEVVELPSGSKVNDANTSSKMFGQGGSNISINISSMNVRQESDIDSIANALASRIRLEMLNMA